MMGNSSSKPVEGWTRPRVVVILTALCLVTLWAMVIIAAIATQQEQLELRKDLLRRMNFAVEEQTRRQFDLATIVLTAAEHLLSPDRNADLRSDAAFRGLIDDLRVKSGRTITIYLVDDAGTALSLGDQHEVLPTDFAHVNATGREGGLSTGGLYIGRPLYNPVTGRSSLPVSLPLSQPVNGISALLAIIDLTALANAYEEQREKAGGRIALLGRDGIIVTLVPANEPTFGQPVRDAETFRALLDNQESGVFVRGEQEAGKELVSYAAMLDYPLLTLVAEDYDRALAPWLRQTVWMIALAIGVSIPAVVVAYRSIRLLQLVAHRDEQLSRLSTVDPLTRASSRQHFVAALGEALARARRSQTELTLVLFKIDFFQRITDGYGHAVGEQALVAFADVTRGCLREVDHLGRLAAGEFVILLPEATVEAAAAVAERVRRGVARIAIDTEDGTLLFTTSANVIRAGGDGSTAETVLKRGLQSLQEAMAAGHDRVVVTGSV